jgi:glycosyltransferase involved in cell wall biosynthesis
MIIGIDISQIVYKTGVSRYTEELVRNLLRIDKNNRYKLFAGVWRQRKIVEDFLRELTTEKLDFESYIKLLPPLAAELLWNDLHLVTIESFMGKVDLFHTSNWAQPPAKAKKVTTVHDLVPILYTEHLVPKIVQNFNNNIKWIKKECERIIAVSESTKADLINQIGISGDQIDVVYSGVSNKFKPVTNALQIEKVKKKYGIEKDYFLTVGTLEPRKNIDKVVEAFEKINNKDLSLVIAGKYGWGQRQAEDRDRIITTGFVSDEDLPALYSGSKAFIYVSLYEGFGLPVLEAMGCGCPVVTSNVSSLPEVAGGAALLVNPNSAKEIVAAVNKIVEDKELRKKLSKQSLLQAEKFSWKTTAEKTLEVYNKVV